jgi:hypothetical protein
MSLPINEAVADPGPKLRAASNAPGSNLRPEVAMHVVRAEPSQTAKPFVAYLG